MTRAALRFLLARTVADGSCAVQGAVPEELWNEERTRDCRKLPRHVEDTLEKGSDTVCAIASGHSRTSMLHTKYWEMDPVCGGQREAVHTWFHQSWCVSFDLFHEMFLRNAK